MEHDGELWQEYDARAERVMNGGITPGDPVEEGGLYGGAAVMLYRFKDGKVQFLFQHRSKMLKGNPDKWDVSAGGHINYNEPKLDAALRETREEIGIELDKENLELSACYVRSNNYVCLFFYDFTYEKDEFSFYDNEVEEVKWVDFDDLDAFLPKLKAKIGEDKIFTTCLSTWMKRTQEKYGNLDK